MGVGISLLVFVCKQLDKIPVSRGHGSRAMSISARTIRWLRIWVHTCCYASWGTTRQKWYPIFGYQNKCPTQATVVLSPPTCRNGLWPTCFPCWIAFCFASPTFCNCEGLQCSADTPGASFFSVSWHAKVETSSSLWLKGFCFWYTFSSFYSQQGTHHFRDDQQLDEPSVNIWEIKKAEDETRPCATLPTQLLLHASCTWAEFRIGLHRKPKIGPMYFSI